MCIQKGLCLSGALLWKGVKHSPETAAVSPLELCREEGTLTGSAPCSVRPQTLKEQRGWARVAQY